MTTRRSFIAGLGAVGLSAQVTWADVGAPSFLSAAKDVDGSYVLAGLSRTGTIVFQIPLPTRGHAAAIHPVRPEAVAFARRPGVYALVLDCVTGKVTAQLDSPANRHFYGHGTFSSDGARLYTTENDLESGNGVVGVWSTAQGYRRVGEFVSGGIGPHDIKLMPDGETLVVANGGIETHPDSGRTKLNIPTMQSCLSYLSLSGDLLEQVELQSSLRKNSIRHLSVSDGGLVAFAMQWQGDRTLDPPLIGLHRRGAAVKLLQATPQDHRTLRGYIGSIALSRDAREVAVTSPKGGVVQVFQTDNRAQYFVIPLQDVGGICASSSAFHVSSGTGSWGTISQGGFSTRKDLLLQWDNHLMSATCLP